MAKEPKGPKGSITQPADSKNERISEISNVNRTISNMQKQVESQLVDTEKDLRDSDAIQSVQHSLTKVLSKLSSTVGEIGKGFSSIALTTAQTGKEAIKDYGRAISQEFAIDKQKFVAMTLARSTPIYGYFISKFMETNVWKNATEKLKTNISSALSNVGGALKDFIKIPFSKRKYSSTRKDADFKDTKVPKMQRGGYVEKAGLAKVHAAEVVMPIEKVLSRIDESISVSKELARHTTLHQLQSLTKFNQYVQDNEKYQKVGLVKGFFQALKIVNTRYEQPASTRILRAVLSIQDTMGATIGKWPQVWQKLLVEHPLLRNTVFFLRAMHETLRLPGRALYALFKGRGEYKSHLSKAKSPMQATAENVGVLYTESMYKFDNIILYTKATAQATRDISTFFTKRAYPPLRGIQRKTWSLAGGIFKGIADIVSAPFALTGMLGDMAVKAALALTSGPSGGKKPAAERTAESVDELKNDNKTNFNMSQKLLNKIREYTKKTESHSEVTAEKLEDHDKREKRRTLLGFLGGGFSPVKSLLGGLFGKFMFMKMILGGAGTFFRELFLGKGAKGSIIGGLFKRLGLTKIKVPGGFAGKIFPTLLKLKGLSWLLGGKLGLAILGGITAWKAGNWAVDKIEAWLSAQPWVQKRREDSAARAQREGWTDEDTGIDILHKQMDKAKQARTHTQDAVALNQKIKELNAAQHAPTAHARVIEHISSISSGMNNQELRKKDVGPHGVGQLDKIFTGQNKFMHQNYPKYLNYDPTHVNEIRTQWLKQGGYKSKGFFQNPEKYGMKREEDFLKYLEKHGTPFTEDEMAFRQKQFRAETGNQTIRDRIDTVADIGKGVVDTARGWIGNNVDIEDLRHELEKSYKTTSVRTEDALKKAKEESEGLYQKTKTLLEPFSNTTRDMSTALTAKMYELKDYRTVERDVASLYEQSKIYAKSLGIDNQVIPGIAADKATAIQAHTKASESKNPVVRMFDLIRQSVANMIPQQATNEQLEKAVKVQQKIVENVKDTSANVVNAIQNQSTIISNNINNVTTNNTGGGVMGWLSGMRDKFTDYTIRGEVDGD